MEMLAAQAAITQNTRGRVRRSMTEAEKLSDIKRVERVMRIPSYMYNPEFDDKSRYDALLGPMPEATTKTRQTKAPAGLPPYLASLYDTPLLTREQEGHLFKKMNLFLHLASREIENLKGKDAEKIKPQKLDLIEKWKEEASTIKQQIVSANLRLVVSLAKKQMNPQRDFFELVSDGNMPLIRAVDRFDPYRGNKFSTYASWAIIRNFQRTLPEEKERRDRFLNGYDELFDAAVDTRSNQREIENTQAKVEEQVMGLLGRLDERERRIILSRYGIGGADELSLEKLGRELGITKERVRQIESRAEEKLRKFALEEGVTL